MTITRSGVVTVAIVLIMATSLAALQPVVIQVTPANQSIFQGATLQFAAVRLYIGSVSKPGGARSVTVTWKSSVQTVATVNPATGLVTAQMPGTTIIEADSGPFHGTTTLTVTPSPCASGFPNQTFDSFMHSCAVTVSFASRATACSAGHHVCTASEWNAHRGATAPTLDYWTGDNPLNFILGGSTNSCTVSATAGTNVCAPGVGAMLVCPNGSGNCQLTGCGLDSTTRQFFGGCATNGTPGDFSIASGSLCCGP